MSACAGVRRTLRSWGMMADGTASATPRDERIKADPRSRNVIGPGVLFHPRGSACGVHGLALEVVRQFGTNRNEIVRQIVGVKVHEEFERS
jgi:hypothetical protein